MKNFDQSVGGWQISAELAIPQGIGPAEHKKREFERYGGAAGAWGFWRSADWPCRETGRTQKGWACPYCKASLVRYIYRFSVDQFGPTGRLV